MTLAFSHSNRMVFYESGNIDNLFRGIENLIRVPIEHIVIESRRRVTRRYIEKIYSGARADEVELTREGLREKALPVDSTAKRGLLELAREINLNINDIGRAYGYGDIDLSEGWEKDRDEPLAQLVDTRSLLGALLRRGHAGIGGGRRGSRPRRLMPRDGKGALRGHLAPGQPPHRAPGEDAART